MGLETPRISRGVPFLCKEPHGVGRREKTSLTWDYSGSLCDQTSRRIPRQISAAAEQAKPALARASPLLTLGEDHAWFKCLQPSFSCCVESCKFLCTTGKFSANFRGRRLGLSSLPRHGVRKGVVPEWQVGGACQSPIPLSR